MDVKSLILYGKKRFINVTDTPRLESEILLAHTLKIKREKLLACLNQNVSLDNEKTFKTLIEKRKNHYPLPYIINYKEFMGIDFFIQQGVLIPRPETEMLAEEALKIASSKKVRILDIGTGSGCILLSFLHYNKLSKGIGVDISDIAIKTAIENALRLGLSDRATFIQKDFKNISFNDAFDIVVSNPPYVKTSQCKNLYFEPIQALDGGEDGFHFYPMLIEKAYGFLKNNGTLIIEIDEGIEKRTKEAMEKTGFKGIKMIRDLAGLSRVAEGTKNG